MKRFRFAAFWIGVASILGAPGIAPAAGEPHKPGTLISQTPIDRPPSGASAWKIRYWSLAENGASVEVSGAVFIPAGAPPQAGRDIIAWGHGTVGITQSCQPSSSPDLFTNIPALKAALEKGYIVTATDFQGLGTPGPHPYLVGVSSGRAILDSIRATRALPEAHAGTRYVVWGESQGAHAGLWAAQMARDYAPELDLVGIVAASPPTDLVANYQAHTSRLAHSLITSLTTASWSQIYHINLSTFANPFGRYVIHKLSRDCLHREPVSAFSNTLVLLLSNQIPYNLSKEWEDRLRQNSAPTARYRAPLMIVQDTPDDVVPPKLTRDFAEKSCRAGTTLHFLTVEGGGHTEVATRSADASLQWISERFAGKSPVNDCERLPRLDDAR